MTIPSISREPYRVQYREYQQRQHNDIYDMWAQGARNVMAVLPTGGGKSLLTSGVIRQHDRGLKVAIAHRKELVGQIALALGQNGVSHNIIGPKELVKYIIHRQRLKLGTHFFNANAQCTVASVDTLISPSRAGSLQSWGQQVGLWVIDEAHHITCDNKWGKAVTMFPNAHGLGVTATPLRADGKGLGRASDGVFDEMVQGPTMRELISAGFLCEYRIFAPLTYMPLSDDDVGASGDWSRNKLKAASQASPIVGDVVKSYFQYAQGKSTVVFATDLETAGQMRNKYLAGGVRAEVISAETKDTVRSEVLDRFERKELDAIVNVDLLGEGFDCPGIEVVIMARPTDSYGLFCQQFGRALRILEGKQFAVIIDHVGNVKRHGLPDTARVWTLDAREKRPRTVDPDDEVPVRYCDNPMCTQPYPRYKVQCPWCGHYPTPDPRGAPEFVDGDVYEISQEVLAKMRGEIERIDMPAWVVADRMRKAGADPRVAGATFKKIEARGNMQEALRTSMGWWAAVHEQKGYSERELYRLFYHVFGIDVLSAKALGRPEALSLANKINHTLGGPKA